MSRAFKEKIVNSTQRLVVVCAAIAIAAMIAFPPYQFGTEFSLSTASRGYWFIGNPPLFGNINYALLFVQCAVVGFLAAVLYFVTKGK